ncbi:MAG: hypothetical protein HY654_02530 [Acidobacteria bacterium]|nr:hypothetical protein [Acidobacteriota bacterium]
MGALQERVSYIEGRVEEQSRTFGELRELILAVDQRVSALDQKVDRRFDAVDRRFEALEGRFSTFVTLQVSILVAIIAGLSGILGVMLTR